jgi:hypothetical protein
MRAMNGSIIPERSYTLVVISMKMSKKMMESTLRKRFTEIKIIDNDIGIGNNSSHFIIIHKTEYNTIIDLLKNHTP